jgi:hypothetical protein
MDRHQLKFKKNIFIVIKYPKGNPFTINRLTLGSKEI